MLKFIQLCAAPWEGRQDGNMTFTLFGLTAEGAVYRLTGKGWKAESMAIVPDLTPTGGKPNEKDDKPW